GVDPHAVRRARLVIVSGMRTTRTSARRSGAAISAKAARNPKALVETPATSGPNTKPMSPKNRNTPTAVPDRRSGATSESIEDGATATEPDPTPMRPSTTPNTSGDPANPPTATAAANHASAGITSARRPNRSAQ